MEPITVTRDEIIYHRRVRVLEHAAETGNVSLIHELLALAVAEPTLGCRQLADRLVDRGYVVSKTTVQKILVDTPWAGAASGSPGPPRWRR